MPILKKFLTCNNHKLKEGILNVEKDFEVEGPYVVVRQHPKKGYSFIKTSMIEVSNKVLGERAINKNRKSKNPCCYLEGILGHMPRKIYFDFDDVSNERAEYLLGKIKEVLPNAECAISGYTNQQGNNNWHVCVSNYFFDDNRHMIESGFIDWYRQVKIDCGYTEEAHKQWKIDTGNPNTNYHVWGMDCSVYPSKGVEKGEWKSLNAFQQFKMVRQSKCGKTAYNEVIKDDDLLNHFVQFIPEGCIRVGAEFKDYYKDKVAETTTQEIDREKLNFRNLLTTIPCSKNLHTTYDPSIFHNNLGIGYTEEMLDKILELFDNTLIYPNIVYKIAYSFFKSNWYDFDTVYDHFEHAFTINPSHHPSANPRGTWKHMWNDIVRCDKHKNVSKVKAMIEAIYRNGVFVSEWEENFRGAITCKHDLPIHEEFTQQHHLEDMFAEGADVILNTSVLGGGKTYSVMEYCKRHRPKRILILSSKITLSYDLLGVFNSNEAGLSLGFTHYKDVKCDPECEGTNQASVNRGKKLKKVDKLVCSIHSLHYLRGKGEQPFDLIVADEIKDLWCQFSSKNCMKHYEKYDKFDYNYRALVWHIQQTKKVFFMDALMPNKVKDWIAMVKPNSVIRTIKVEKEIPRTCYLIRKRSIEPIVKIMLDKLALGKKIYVYYPFATDKGTYKLSIRRFGQMICDKAGLDFGNGTDKDIIIIQGSTDAEIKQQMRDVNSLWGGKRIILVNSATTIGVSYTNHDVSSVFLCWDTFIPISDILQTSVRCRKLIDNDVYIWRMINADEINNVDRRVNKWMPSLGPDDRNTIEMRSSHQMIASHLDIEHKGNTWQMLVHLFEKTGHTIVRDYDIEDTEDLKKSLKTWRKDNTYSPFDYDNLELIDENTAHKFRVKEAENRNTELEHWLLRKFYINHQFIPETPEGIKKEFFDRENILRSLRLLTFHPNNGYDDEKNILKYALWTNYDKREDGKTYISWTINNQKIKDKQGLKDELGLVGSQRKAMKDWVYKKYILAHFFGIDKAITSEKGKGLILHEKIKNWLENYAQYSRRCSPDYDYDGNKLKEYAMIDEDPANDPLEMSGQVCEDTDSEDEVEEVKENDTSEDNDSLDNILNMVGEMRDGAVGGTGDGFDDFSAPMDI